MSSIFPFLNPEAMLEETQAELPIYREYAYDFENNQLLLDKDGKTYLVEKNEAIRIWIFKAFTTARFRYTAHSADFGNEYQDNLIGQNISEDILEAELERYVIECLMVNPYIKELANFDFETYKNGLKVEFDCLTVYGEEKIEFPFEGVRT